jgi:MFS family permease
MSDQNKARRTFFGIASFQALAMFRRGLFYSYLSIYLRFFLGLSVTETTFFATFPMVLNIVFQTFVWGVISDKYQKRRTLIILGEIFAAISTFFVWLVHTIPASTYTAGYIIILGMSFVEIFWSMSNIGWSAIISDLYPEHQRTEIQGKLMSIGAFGRIIGVWIGGIAYDGLAHYYNGWGFDKGLLFFIASGIMILSTIPMFFVPEGGIAAQKGSPQKEPDRLDQTKTVISSTKIFIVFLLAMVFINFGRNSIALITAQYLSLDQGFNVSSSLLSYIVNMQSLASLISGLFVARLAKRFSDNTLLMFGSIIALIQLLGFMLGTTLTIIFLSSFLCGISMVVIMASAYSYVSRLIPPQKRGKQFALFNATFFLSWGVAGTLVAGPVVDILLKSGADQIFAYRMSFLSAAILVIIGIIIFIFVDRIAQRARA